jgi:hypothetical protein
MADESTITAPPAVPDPAAATTPAAANDPFSLDENALVSLSPEQRAGLEPVLNGWREKAQAEIKKREDTVAERYKPHEEKAQALEKLVNYAPFVKWWQEQQQQAVQGGAQPNQVAQQSPFQVATPQQWSEAVVEMANGDPAKFNDLQQKSVLALARPFFQENAQEIQALKVERDLQHLFRTHPDAVDLDKIGIDPNDKESVSLLEEALDLADRRGKPLEWGYNMAKRWYDAMTVNAQQRAMGMVNDKKTSVTTGPGTSSPKGTVVEVADYGELLKADLQAQMRGDKETRFVIKSK